MTKWIIICNINKYDVIKAFNTLDTLDWKQTNNIGVGDIVYIYIGAPIKAIRYKCEAIAVDLSNHLIDDSAFILDGSNYLSSNRHMRLHCLEKYDDEMLCLQNLREHGLKTVQGTSKVNQELEKYIASVTINSLSPDILLSEASNDSSLVESLNQLIWTNDEKFKHKGICKPKTTPIQQNGRKTYPRDKQTSINALSYANNECEIDSSHVSFTRKNSEVKYMEPHHLIPMAYSDLFEFSLDVEENIVSLCSNCHNQIHYGRDAKILIDKLYTQRKDSLSKVGIKISLAKLIEMYNLS